MGASQTIMTSGSWRWGTAFTVGWVDCLNGIKSLERCLGGIPQGVYVVKGCDERQEQILLVENDSWSHILGKKLRQKMIIGVGGGP